MESCFFMPRLMSACRQLSKVRFAKAALLGNIRLVLAVSGSRTTRSTESLTCQGSGLSHHLVGKNRKSLPGSRPAWRLRTPSTQRRATCGSEARSHGFVGHGVGNTHSLSTAPPTKIWAQPSLRRRPITNLPKKLLRQASLSRRSQTFSTSSTKPSSRLAVSDISLLTMA